ncbi:hypothetical protein P7K49_032553 [Saguinus oedipus]|uniref:Phosphodiesterase n=1 Tax=Saguinus oedipus TaxID=9490 RepID=A0ABQ9U0G4_SAGOE|nr:hypothetical protein P7K49_032553 [Saguinus oedipus]
MLSCLEHMYHDLGLVRDFSINPVTLRRWLVSARPAFGSSRAGGFIQFHRHGGNASPGHLPDGTALPESGGDVPREFCEDSQPASVHPSTKKRLHPSSCSDEQENSETLTSSSRAACAKAAACGSRLRITSLASVVNTRRLLTSAWDEGLAENIQASAQPSGWLGRSSGWAQAQGYPDPLPPAALCARQLQKQPLPQLPALLLRGPDDVQHGLALRSPGGSCPPHTQTSISGSGGGSFRGAAAPSHQECHRHGVLSRSALLGKHPYPSVSPWERLLLGLPEQVHPDLVTPPPRRQASPLPPRRETPRGCRGFVLSTTAPHPVPPPSPRPTLQVERANTYACFPIQEKFSQMDILILMTAAICHDLDHPGYNNTYQINARTELAVRYNDISPLENHHCAVAFQILAQPECNIFSSVPADGFKQIRQVRGQTSATGSLNGSFQRQPTKAVWTPVLPLSESSSLVDHDFPICLRFQEVQSSM